MKEKSLKFRTIFEIVFSIYTVLLGAMFIWHTLDIYLDGIANTNLNNDIYSREIVSTHLSQILIFAILWIILIIVGFILFKKFPKNEKPLVYKEPIYQLNRVKNRSKENINDFDFVVKENKKLFIFKIVSLAFWLGTIVWSVIYLSNPTNFPKVDVTKEILKMVLNIFPFIVLSLISSCTVLYLESNSANYILSQIKEQKIVLNKKENVVKNKTNNKKILLAVRISVAVIALTFIVLGAFNGTMRDVLIKAINICTECIGLG